MLKPLSALPAHHGPKRLGGNKMTTEWHGTDKVGLHHPSFRNSSWLERKNARRPPRLHPLKSMRASSASFWHRHFPSASAASAALALAILAGWGGTASAQSVANGQALYAGCSGCHGPTPATGAAKIQLGTSAAVIQNATLNVGVMRGIALSATQAADLAAFIAASVAGTSTGTSPTTPLPTYALASGQGLYGMCAGCHGVSPAQGRDDIDKATSAAAILRAIQKEPVMRGLSLSTAQAADIATYVRSQLGSSAGASWTQRSGGDGNEGEGDSNGFGRDQAAMAGGCTLGRADQPFDPLWMLMLAGALGVLGLRRSAKV